MTTALNVELIEEVKFNYDLKRWMNPFGRTTPYKTLIQ